MDPIFWFFKFLEKFLQTFPVFPALLSPFPLRLLPFGGLNPALIHLLSHSLHCTLYKIFHSSELSPSLSAPVTTIKNISSIAKCASGEKNCPGWEPLCYGVPGFLSYAIGTYHLVEFLSSAPLSAPVSQNTQILARMFSFKMARFQVCSNPPKNTELVNASSGDYTFF